MNEQQDSLEGFRRERRDGYDELEDELRAFRSLAVDDEDMGLLQEVLKKNAVVAALRQQDAPFRRLATHAAQVLDHAQKRWVENPDPRSDKAINAHHDARAARLVLDWIADQIEVGEEAERRLEVEGQYE